MAKKYLDNDGLLYLWQKIKTYFTGTATPSMDGTGATGSSQKFAREDHVHPTDTSRAPTSHSSSATTYGTGTSSNYGHVKLSDSTSSTTAAASGGTAATPKAVKDALDAAKAYADSLPQGSVTDVKVDNASVVTSGVANIDLTGKVDVEAGKGLSTNDYTTAEKTKLAGIETGAEVNTIESVSVNGTAVTPDPTKNVDITIPDGTSVNGMTGDVNLGYTVEHQFGLLQDLTEELYINMTIANDDDDVIITREIPVATTDGNGIMSAADKTKLNGIAAGAEVNVLESITVNGVGQAISIDKNVDISVPTRVSDLTNDSGFVTSDTKNTAGSTNTSRKIFLIGATSQAANPQTYSRSTAYVGTDGHLYSNNLQVVNLSGSQALTNKTYNGYTLAAACAKGVDTSIAAGSSSTNVPTSAAVASAISAAQVGAAMFQGTVNTPTDISGLTAYKKGYYWVVATAGTYAENVCEVGDMIFAIADRGNSTQNSDFSVVQSNLELAAITNAEIDTIMAS